MKRRDALRTLSLVVLAAHVPPSRPDQPTRLPVIGVPLIAAGPDDPIMVNLRRGLTERGYVQGRNIQIQHRFTHGKLEPLPGLVSEMVRKKVDIIVAGAEVIAKAAAQATATIPIILIAWDYDPVASGLVRSLNKPGGNVTGVYLRVVETVSKRLEVLREILPGLSRVAVLYDHYGKRQLPNTAPAAVALGLSVVPIEVREPYDFLAALKEAKARKVGAVSVLFSPIFYVDRQRLTDAARTLQLPTMFQEYGSVQTGGLASYGPSPTDGWYRAAYFIDRILKGSKPSELPIERPDVYYLAVNMQTAKALGITIPESVLLRADEVIR